MTVLSNALAGCFGLFGHQDPDFDMSLHPYILSQGRHWNVYLNTLDKGRVWQAKFLMRDDAVEFIKSSQSKWSVT